jgi:hypothetical protein
MVPVLVVIHSSSSSSSSRRARPSSPSSPDAPLRLIALLIARPNVFRARNVATSLRLARRSLTSRTQAPRAPARVAQTPVRHSHRLELARVTLAPRARLFRFILAHLKPPRHFLSTPLAHARQGEVTKAPFPLAVALVALNVALGDERDAVLVLLRARASVRHGAGGLSTFGRAHRSSRRGSGSRRRARRRVGTPSAVGGCRGRAEPTGEGEAPHVVGVDGERGA